MSLRKGQAIEWDPDLGEEKQSSFRSKGWNCQQSNQHPWQPSQLRPSFFPHSFLFLILESLLWFRLPLRQVSWAKVLKRPNVRVLKGSHPQYPGEDLAGKGTSPKLEPMSLEWQPQQHGLHCTFQYTSVTGISTTASSEKRKMPSLVETDCLSAAGAPALLVVGSLQKRQLAAAPICLSL